MWDKLIRLLTEISFVEKLKRLQYLERENERLNRTVDRLLKILEKRKWV